MTWAEAEIEMNGNGFEIGMNGTEAETQSEIEKNGTEICLEMFHHVSIGIGMWDNLELQNYFHVDRLNFLLYCYPHIHIAVPVVVVAVIFHAVAVVLGMSFQHMSFDRHSQIQTAF